MWITVVLSFVTEFLKGKNKSLYSWILIAIILGAALSIKASVQLSNQYTDNKATEIRKDKQIDSIQINNLISNQDKLSNKVDKMSDRIDTMYDILIKENNKRGRNGH